MINILVTSMKIMRTSQITEILIDAYKLDIQLYSWSRPLFSLMTLESYASTIIPLYTLGIETFYMNRSESDLFI